MNAPTLTGNRCQCPACREYFNGVQGFDDHRHGPYDGKRHCLTVTEMQARGWCRNDKGFWVTDTRQQRAARRAAGRVTGPSTSPAMQPAGGGHV